MTLAVALMALASVVNPVTEHTRLRTFRLPQQVEISVPADWKVVGEEGLRKYEVVRDSALKNQGLSVDSPGEVSFQAMRQSPSSSISTMLTFLPPESTQEEVANWPPTVLEDIGRALADAQRKGLVAAGARNISTTPAVRTALGGKTAIHFVMEFTAPDSRRYSAEKFFLYTLTRTVILTLEWTTPAGRLARQDRDRIVASLRVE